MSSSTAGPGAIRALAGSVEINADRAPDERRTLVILISDLWTEPEAEHRAEFARPGFDVLVRPATLDLQRVAEQRQAARAGQVLVAAQRGLSHCRCVRRSRASAAS